MVGQQQGAAEAGQVAVEGRQQLQLLVQVVRQLFAALSGVSPPQHTEGKAARSSPGDLLIQQLQEAYMSTSAQLRASLSLLCNLPEAKAAAAAHQGKAIF